MVRIRSPLKAQGKRQSLARAEVIIRAHCQHEKAFEYPCQSYKGRGTSETRAPAANAIYAPGKATVPRQI